MAGRASNPVHPVVHRETGNYWLNFGFMSRNNFTLQILFIIPRTNHDKIRTRHRNTRLNSSNQSWHG
jgi:hypothetical protein